MLSSDISHWDVDEHGSGAGRTPTPSSTQGLLTADQFADFTFRNPARLFTERNPSFFDGTAVADRGRGAPGRGDGPLTTALCGAWVIDGTGTDRRRATVVVDGEAIVDVRPGDSPSHEDRAADAVVDLDGLVLAPASSTSTRTTTRR